jgi:hypothetical protein
MHFHCVQISHFLIDLPLKNGMITATRPQDLGRQGLSPLSRDGAEGVKLPEPVVEFYDPEILHMLSNY